MASLNQTSSVGINQRLSLHEGQGGGNMSSLVGGGAVALSQEREFHSLSSEHYAPSNKQQNAHDQ